MTTAGAPDIHEMLGLRTIAARILIAAFIATYALVAATTGPTGSFWYELAAWLIVSLAAVALIMVPGDPLPMPVAAALTVSGVVAMNVMLLVIHPPFSGLQLWPLSAVTAIYAYLCVRGRTPWAWIGMLAVLGSYMLWAQRTGMGYVTGLQLSVINFAPLVVATFFGWTIRPAARSIFALRRQATVRVAAEAADAAVLDERDLRLTQLDQLTRPLLERLAGYGYLTDDDRTSAGLLEAHLRDTLRAPTLTTPEISCAVHQARSRGVEVVMLDDHGLDDVPTDLRDELLGRVLDALTAASSGTITIRILPPRRDALLTILHRTPEVSRRLEFGLSGQMTRRDSPVRTTTRS
ncbi:hypothetical protein DFR67_102297 [Williamsia limnetica]|uniref:Uncharacterized protein n=1 Tax=Williamsia limnetica TaxID=882452 RepID=A0A318RUS2_WILLI|nr:hypothetical protein [Williamsia limnetica]PYE20159.1 hypothetical protein DFR67_102297 [Williamsia limnetica]